ncbi:MAG: hypothetical protein ABTQ32_26335 [Myxococcaceae bacterium]
MLKPLSWCVVLFLVACDVSPSSVCTVPVGTSWSKELEPLSTEGLRPVGPPAPTRAETGMATCLPDAGADPHACRRLVGRPYSGERCFEGYVGCYVWVQDDRVVGRASLCWN